MVLSVKRQTTDVLLYYPRKEDFDMSKNNNTEKRPTTASAGSRATPPKTNENTTHNLRKD